MDPLWLLIPSRSRIRAQLFGIDKVQPFGVSSHLILDNFGLFFLISLETRKPEDLFRLEPESFHYTIPLYMQHLLLKARIKQFVIDLLGDAFGPDVRIWGQAGLEGVSRPDVYALVYDVELSLL